MKEVKILHKRGLRAPVDDEIDVGEVVINSADGELYVKTDGGDIVAVGGGDGGGGDVDLSNYIDRTKRNDVVEGSFSIHWDDSSDQTYPFNGRIGYNSSAADPNSLEGSFLYASGTRGTFSIGRDGDVELHGPSEIQGIPDRNDDRPWITGFSYVQAADFLDEDGNSIVPDVSNLMSTDSLNQCRDEAWGIIGEGFEFRTDSLRTNRFFNHIFQDWYSISSSTDPDTHVFRLTAVGGGAAYFNGTVQATDYLDADGNSIIGGGGEDHSHTDDKNNIFIGENALAQNEGGFDNVGIGKSALINSITGIYNTAIGSKAMRGNTGGNSNTAVGYDANSGLDSGNYNTAIGSSALSSASVGSTKLTGIGSFSGVKNPFGPALENSTAIGYYAEVDASNKIQLGNTDVELVHTHGVMQAADFLDADGNSIIGSGGGGGGAVDSVNGKTGKVVLNYTDVGAQQAGSYAASNHNHNGVYQPAGSYAASNHNHSGVYAPASHTHNYAAVGASYTKSESDGKYALKGSGGDDPNAVKLTGNQTVMGVKKFLGGSTYFQNLFIEGVPAGGVGFAGQSRIEFSSGATTLYGSSNTLQVNSAGTSITGGITCTGVITGTDCVASSDERLKDNITTAPVGLIESLQGREWEWKESGEKGSGVVAQELEKVLPHLVHEDSEGMKSVSYNGLVAYLIEEVKALKAEVETIRNG